MKGLQSFSITTSQAEAQKIFETVEVEETYDFNANSQPSQQQFIQPESNFDYQQNNQVFPLGNPPAGINISDEFGGNFQNKNQAFNQTRIGEDWFASENIAEHSAVSLDNNNSQNVGKNYYAGLNDSYPLDSAQIPNSGVFNVMNNASDKNYGKIIKF